MPAYVPSEEEDDEEDGKVTGCSAEDATSFSTPIEEEETAGLIYFTGQDVAIDGFESQTGGGGLRCRGPGEGNDDIFQNSNPSEENATYIPPKSKHEPGLRKVRRVSLLGGSNNLSCMCLGLGSTKVFNSGIFGTLATAFVLSVFTVWSYAVSLAVETLSLY